MSVKKLLFIFSFTTACAIHLCAQSHSITKKDTTTIPADSSKVFTFDENGLQNYSDGQIPAQLSNHLDGFQIYHERQANLGNAGSAEKNLSVPVITSNGFTRGSNSFSYFGFNDLNRTFYSCNKPYTKIAYVTGQKQEVNAFVTHAHPLGKNCLIGFGFDRIRSTGYYKKQNTNNTSVDLNGWYRAPGRHYAFLADVNWTTINEAENGGIKRDSSFFFANQLDRQLVGVYLSSAKTSQRVREAWFKQYWAFGSFVDSVRVDSNTMRARIKPQWAIVNTSSIADQMYKFTDKDTLSDYFPAQYSDTSLTKDSTYMWKAKSGLWLERFGPDFSDSTGKTIFGKAGIRAEAGEYFNDTIYKHFQNLFADGSMTIDLRKAFAQKSTGASFFRVSGWRIIGGTNAGDYQVNAKLLETFSNQQLIWIDGSVSNRHPDFLYDHYSGNHYRWENDFSDIQASAFHVNIKEEFGKAKGNFIWISGGTNAFTHVVYFDSAYSIPQQYDSTIIMYDPRIRFFDCIGPIRTMTDATCNFAEKGSPIHLPKYVIRESLYSEFKLFKNALLLQTGIDATYFSSFYCDVWNPNLAQFFVQNSTASKDYVYLDVWVAMKIKPVRVFVKADNFNCTFSGRKYMLIPHAPQNDMSIKFGVSWVFND